MNFGGLVALRGASLFREPRRRSVTLESQRGYFSARAHDSRPGPLLQPTALLAKRPRVRYALAPELGLWLRAARQLAQIPILLLDLYPRLNSLRNRH